MGTHLCFIPKNCEAGSTCLECAGVTFSRTEGKCAHSLTASCTYLPVNFQVTGHICTTLRRINEYSNWAKVFQGFTKPISFRDPLGAHQAYALFGENDAHASHWQVDIEIERQISTHVS